MDEEPILPDYGLADLTLANLDDAVPPRPPPPRPPHPVLSLSAVQPLPHPPSRSRPRYRPLSPYHPPADGLRLATCARACGGAALVDLVELEISKADPAVSAYYDAK